MRAAKTPGTFQGMWLAYVDESGTTGRRFDDPDQPIHWLVAVLVPEDHVLALTADLEGVVARSHPAKPTAELHGAQLFGGDGDWRGISPAQRVAAYEAALALLAKHDAVVVHSSINKARLWPSDSKATTPHLLALQFLVERVDTYIAGQSDPLRRRALLVADETNEHEAFSIGLVAGLQTLGVGVVAGRLVEHIIDTVHFVRSHDNRGVQLADLVAYALNRTRRRRNRPQLSPGDQALSRIFDEQVAPLIRTWRETWPR